MKNNDLLKLNIQMFAEDPNQESIESLGKDLMGEEVPKGEETTVEETTGEETTGEETTGEETTGEETTGEETTGEDPKKKEEEEEPKKNNPVAQMRETVKEREARIKELEEKQKEQEGLNQKLFRAAQLGIKGETIEEVLDALEEHDVKSEAQKSGLTEDQIKKEKELSERLTNLNQKESEMMFNQRAYNLQREKGLTDEQLGQFIKDSAAIGVNLLNTGVDFKKIYERLNPSDTSGNLISEKDKRIAELENEINTLKKNTVPGATVPGTQGGESTTGDPEMDKLLGDLT